ncbi:hypothetical protein HPB50_009380 [Hyalomma asiaticum]|uniref:Uncharacterized protein n=1 Tax=Hyalomma asiaticum TaxID=266040 RepID=A0ACB7SFU5_HYAAI|nr:hypothetical protein HPB50_009380 [Hyalomma asiaticum]
MDYQVEGEDITPGEITEALGWRTAGARKARSQRRDAAVSNGTALERAEPKRHGVNTKAGIKLGVIKASRMPPLPREEIKIVIRPQGGLNILKIGAPTVTTAIFASAEIAKEESTDDTVCPNPRQNIVFENIRNLQMAVASLVSKVASIESNINSIMAASQQQQPQIVQQQLQYNAGQAPGPPNNHHGACH